MSFERFALKQFSKEIKRLGYTKEEVLQVIWQFRFMCFKLNFFLQHLSIPTIKSKSYYEAVLIEFRILPHLEFIIRNTILKLGNDWSHTIVCGNANYMYIKKICMKIHDKIRIVQLPYENLNQQAYSNLLLTQEFWKTFHGEKILIYQEDSLMFRSGIERFVQVDYIGAPFHQESDDTPNGVGNGGFSLRTKSKMLEVLQTCPIEDVEIPSTTQSYMKMVGMTDIPEDVYFSRCLQDHHLGEVATWDLAYDFSSEQVFNPNSVGGHKFWIANTNWKPFVHELFAFKTYVGHSDLNEYLSYLHLPHWQNQTGKIKNAFDVDTYFFSRANNIGMDRVMEYLRHMALDGFLYHPKQLSNLYPSSQLYRFQDNLYVYDARCRMVTLSHFVNQYVYNTSFEYLCGEYIRKKYDTLNDNYDAYLLVFLGNKEAAVSLIQKIIEYQKIQNQLNVAFCINTSSIQDKKELKQLIRENFDFYCIYYSKEMGTDITPTLLMYYNIIKTHHVRHIIKLHTKSISHLYEALTNYVLTRSIPDLAAEYEKPRLCNCIGPEHLYKPLSEDIYNKRLVTKHQDELHMHYSFVMGTIFYCENKVFEKVLQFVQKNVRPYLLNTLYENNSINMEFSPIHFLERLFGVICC